MPAPMPRPRVLVVDDDQLMLHAFRREFSREFDLVLAESARVALPLLEVNVFDVALVDFAMPEMSGVEFLRRARELQPEMARVMLTAHAELPEVTETLSTRLAVAVVGKPWEREPLALLVNHLAEQAAAKR